MNLMPIRNNNPFFFSKHVFDYVNRSPVKKERKKNARHGAKERLLKATTARRLLEDQRGGWSDQAWVLVSG